MSVEALTAMALTSAAASLAKQLYPALVERLKGREEATVNITVAGAELALQPEEAEEVLKLLKKELEATEKVEGTTLNLSREAVAERGKRSEKRPHPRVEAKEAALTPGKVAFGIDPSAVLADARRRIDLVFKFNLAVAIALAVILIGGIGGCVVSALVFREVAWSLVFAGVSAADVLGIYAYKPLDAVNAAIVATQRLDTIHLRLREQLRVCLEHTELRDRIRCQTSVWEAIQRELAALAAPAPR